jgi:hypothetical protein
MTCQRRQNWRYVCSGRCENATYTYAAACTSYGRCTTIYGVDGVLEFWYILIYHHPDVHSVAE